MASAQDFYTTVRNFNARLTTGVTADDGSGSLITPTWWSTTSSAGVRPANPWMLAGLYISDSSGTGVGNAADSLIRVFAVNNATSAEIRLIDVIDLGDPAVSSTTAKGLGIFVSFQVGRHQFEANTDLRFNISVTPTAGNVDVFGYVLAAGV